MKDLEDQLETPDFDTWPIDQTVDTVLAEDGALTVLWSDGRKSQYHALLLAENDPAPDVTHPLSREPLITPVDLPAGLSVTGAERLDDGYVAVFWSHGRRPGRFHPGWLLAHGWFGRAPAQPRPIHWTGEEQPEPPAFNGPEVLEKPETRLAWLRALRDYGVARLEGLPDEDGLLTRISGLIGPIRESNFGRTYTLAIKDDPDSNAYTADPLPQHIDMPTRECPHGLQFLFCRANSTTGGAGIYTDAYRIAADIRREDPETFAALTDIAWPYNNRARDTSYRAAGPVVELDRSGEIVGIRYNTWLRAPLVADLSTQDRAYQAYRAFALRTEDPRYQMVITYRPGDLFAFDNRRALHGRRGYDAAGGQRFIEGVYGDRDDLYSAIRVLERALPGL
ncbi:MAG: TauD/TfdA family dioxygenase [Pseudomonadota bacterium]